MSKGKCFYINLDESTLRRNHIERVIEPLNIDCERFPAIEHYSGTAGCLLSHHSVMEQIQIQPEEFSWFLILEDDAYITPHYSVDDVNKLLQKVEVYLKDAPLIMLGAKINGHKDHGNLPEKHPIHSEFLIGNGTCTTTHAYIISRKYASFLKTQWDTQIEICKQTLQAIKKGKANRIHLIQNCSADHTPWTKLQKRDKWLILDDMFDQTSAIPSTRVIRDENFIENIKK